MTRSLYDPIPSNKASADKFATSHNFMDHSSPFYFTSSSAFHHSIDDFTVPRNPTALPTVASIPIDSPPESQVTIPVRHAISDHASAAAVKIQAAYRSHLTRALLRRILAVDSEASRFEALIQLQDTVDAVRRDERERLRVSEGLMELLLRLDSVPGFYSAVREMRRRVSRRIVGLQEVLDAVAGERVEGLDGFPASWEEVVYGTGGGDREEEEGGEEQQCGFQCFEFETFLL